MISRMSPIIKGKIIPNTSDRTYAEDILNEGHQKELTTYKGVMVSKTHAAKDIFKINLLNMIEK